MRSRVAPLLGLLVFVVLSPGWSDSRRVAEFRDDVGTPPDYIDTGPSANPFFTRIRNAFKGVLRPIRDFFIRKERVNDKDIIPYCVISVDIEEEVVRQLERIGAGDAKTVILKTHPRPVQRDDDTEEYEDDTYEEVLNTDQSTQSNDTSTKPPLVNPEVDYNLQSTFVPSTSPSVGPVNPGQFQDASEECLVVLRKTPKGQPVKVTNSRRRPIRFRRRNK